MDELIIRSLQGLASAEEEQRLEHWRSRSPGNEAHYRALAELWSLAAAAAPGPRLRDLEMPDPDDLIAQAESDAASASSPERARARELPRWVRRLRPAALAAGLVGLGLGLGVLVENREGRVAGSLVESVITTGAGELTTVDLGDGTSIRVGPRSSLRLGLEGNQRVAWLEGRAFFGISADPARPFVVRTAWGEAIVLGTRFEVRSEDEELRVLVVEGVVRVSAGGSAEELHEGELGRSAAGAPPSRDRVDDVFAHLAWMGNALVFQATPLPRVAREVERVYGLEVVVEDPRLHDLTVTATFTDEDAETVLVVLCEIVGAHCDIRDGRARLTSRSGPASVRSEPR